MKATIITIYASNLNIGNRLQNYAVQEILKHLGFRVDSVCFQKSMFDGKQKVKYLLQRSTGYRLPGDKDYWRAFPKRIASYEKFNKKYIRTQQIRRIGQIRHSDYYVIGSDQVWNPEWYDDCEMKKELFLLTFAKPEQKVCLSPSFGIKELPEVWKPWFKRYLLSFPRIAVREDAGAKIVKELTGQDAVVTIDPTLMLDRAEWEKIAVKPARVDCSKNYILTYFLGGRSENVENMVKEYSEKLKADIYHLLDMSEPDLYAAGPSEFIYLISRAELIVTDSFHACVFSFLYGKPFLLYDRAGGDGMMCRMETLFNVFHLRRKYIGSGLKNDILECDYRDGYCELTRERQKLLTYLEESMNLSARMDYKR